MQGSGQEGIKITATENRTRLTRLAFIDFVLAHFALESNVTFAEKIGSLILARGVVFAWIDLRSRSCKIFPENGLECFGHCYREVSINLFYMPEAVL